MRGLQCIGGRGRSSAHRGVPGGWGSRMALRRDVTLCKRSQRSTNNECISSSVNHQQCCTLPNLGTAFPYGCYVLKQCEVRFEFFFQSFGVDLFDFGLYFVSEHTDSTSH